MKPQGALVISLDFELHWGIRDLVPLDRDCRRMLLATRSAIPRLLRIFAEREIHATWATVGLLFGRDRDELEAHLPTLLPTYRDSALSPYQDLGALGRNEEEDPFHYAPSLLDQIAETPGQEIGSHTFSHYYSLATGQTGAQFLADLRAAAAIGKRYGDVLRSVVLPRNQWNPAYVPALCAAGVRSVRVNRTHWAYAPSSRPLDPPAQRAFRLLDSLLPLSGQLDADWPSQGSPRQLTASAFLRLGSAGALHRLQATRLQSGLERAAARGRVFHLWWHPHNLGGDTTASLGAVERFLDRVDALRTRYGLRSLTMSELVDAQRQGAP